MTTVTAPWRAVIVLLAGALALAATPRAWARQSDVIIEWPPKDPRNVKVGEPVPLIPRALLLGAPDRTSPKISPDGKRLAWLAPKDGALNVWVAPLDDPRSAKPVTHDNSRGVKQFEWAYTASHVVFVQDRAGDENWRVFSVRIDTPDAQAVDLTPFAGVQARIAGLSPQRPEEILLGLNDRDPKFHDFYAVRLDSGERTLIRQNPGEQGRGVVSDLIADDDFVCRFALRSNRDDGSETILIADGDGWRDWLTFPAEDALSSRIIDFGAGGKSVFMIDSRGRDTAALTELDATTAEIRAIHAWDDRADAADWLIHPTTKTLQSTGFMWDRRFWKHRDENVGRDLMRMENLMGPGKCEARVASRSLDDQQWIVALVRDEGPTAFFHLDRATGKERFLFMNRGALAKQPLAPMRSETIRSRDGLRLQAYLTLPLNTQEKTLQRPAKPLPMVLLVHGGPWYRDTWGYSATHQLFANRGAAVLSVNYRGSSGFGKAFLNAGNREWAGKMHDDLIDAVNWAIAEKIAEPSKIAIVGASYGGYAALVGLSFTPEVFACGVSIVGPSNLVTLLETVPPYWAPIVQMFRDRVGNETTPEGREFLLSRSPITKVDRIARPLLIAHGENDPRVKRRESEQIVEALKARGVPVLYALFPDEGHGFARPANNVAFWAVAERFVGERLGLTTEPIGKALQGSTISVPEGAALAPGLAEALKP